MDICDIFLNKNLPSAELFHNISLKLGHEINDKTVNNCDELRAALECIDTPLKLNVYISDEPTINDDINDIVQVLTEVSLNRADITISVIEDEFVNIIDSQGHITSEAEPRTIAHQKGDRHPTVHIWIIKKTDMGIYILLQKRSSLKQHHPDCYDVSSAGHVSVGAEYRESAIRELKEELGITAEPKQLELIGMRSSDYSGEGVNDNELSAVYLYRQPINAENLTLQKSEVDSVVWMDLDECLTMINNPQFKHCIYKDELMMIRKAVL